MGCVLSLHRIGAIVVILVVLTFNVHLQVVNIKVSATVTAHDVTRITTGRICSIRDHKKDSRSRSRHSPDLIHHDGQGHYRRRRQCYPCRIPSTVVSCLVENGVFLVENDPSASGGTNATDQNGVVNRTIPEFEDGVEKMYYKDNLARIPDVNDTRRAFYTYQWFLDIPSSAINHDVVGDSLLPIPIPSDHHIIQKADRYFLQFRGISYRSTVYYRYGHGDDDNDGNEDYDGGLPFQTIIIHGTVDGMWRRQTVDVTPYVYNNTLHKIHLVVEPPLHPGIVSARCPPPTSLSSSSSSSKEQPASDNSAFVVGKSSEDYDSDDQPPPCGQGGDHQLAQDAGAMQFAAGWDWSQGIPDRVTGIFDTVQLLRIRDGGVRIQDSYLRTLSISCGTQHEMDDDYDHDYDSKLTIAVVAVETTLVNSLNVPVTGSICLEVVDDKHIGGSGYRTFQGRSSRDGHDDTVIILRRQSITLDALETRVHEWNNLTLTGVRLWWPHTLGEPYLYTGKVYFVPDWEGTDEHKQGDEVVSDQDEWNIGIRMVSTSICPRSGGRAFLINRHRVFLQGGNWIATDAMLQRGTRERYFSEVFLHQFAGLNLIRVWGGGVTERPEFYDACDELGILVLQEFWMSGDNNGRWAGSYDWPLDHDLYLDQALDMVLMIRKHPSLLFWCAGNELWPLSMNPPPKIQEGLRQIINRVDKDRFLIMSSMDGGLKGGNMSEHMDTFALSVEDGPYDMLTPVTYFAERNPGMKNGTTTVAAFQPEVGSSGMPRYRSLQRMGLAENETDFPDESRKYVPMLWEYHKYQSFVLRDVVNNNTFSDGIVAYGKPRTVQEYVARAQLLCLQQYQSLFEGFTSKMFDVDPRVLDACFFRIVELTHSNKIESIGSEPSTT